MKKYYWLIIIILLVLAIAAALFLSEEKTRVSVAENGVKEKSAEIVTGERINVAWRIEELGEDKDFVPVASVRLEVKGNAYELGKFSGNCFEIEKSAWKLLENEISGVVCWWAGGGEEIGIFKYGNKLEIKKGIIEEGGENAGETRNNFQTLFEIGE